MRIAHLTSVHPRYDTRIFLKECTSLANAGFEVNLIVADGKGDEEKHSIHILDAGRKRYNRFFRMTETIFRVYKKAVSTSADVYHMHDPELLFLVPWLLKHGKVIYDAHEDLPRQILSKHWIPKILRHGVSFISEKVENHYSRQVLGIVTATTFIANRFKKINNNVININNYPLLEEFSHVDRKQSNERFACYIGGISAERGIYEMVKAMEFVDGKLLLAGSFSRPIEREKAQKLPGWEKVIELGFCERGKVKEILSNARVGLVLFHPAPNHTNAQPNKLFEYMSSGLPVIASDFPLWRIIVDSADCGICVNPLDPKQISDAIKWILDNPEKAFIMGDAGKKAVEEIYNWEKEEKKMLDFYEDINKLNH